jgi:hypothetical protein
VIWSLGFINFHSRTFLAFCECYVLFIPYNSSKIVNLTALAKNNVEMHKKKRYGVNVNVNLYGRETKRSDIGVR